MTRHRPYGLAALTALSVLAVILLVTGWGSAAEPSIIIFAASNSSKPVSVISAGHPAAIVAGLAAAVLLGRARAARQP